jgi:oligopeptide transport system permease protein
MIRSIFERFLASLLTSVCIYVVTFVLAVAIPGNPFQQGQHRLSPETEAAMRARYSMDDNWSYFGQFLTHALRGDFGPSFHYADWTCNEIIAASAPVSMTLGFSAMLIAVLIGVPIGVWSAARREGIADTLAIGFVLLGVSIPTFVVGSALLTVFAVYLKLAPVGGWGTLAQIPLPAITLALPFTAYISRLTRTGMLDVLSSDFIRTALAKGVSRRMVIWKHAAPVALLPVLSFLGPATAQAMTGSFVVEKVFGVPGMGQHFVNAALNRDVGLMMSTVLVFATLLVFINFLVDVMYAWIDPRVSGVL